MTTPTQEQFFPPFTGPEWDRILNLLVNSNPVTFGIRGEFRSNRGLASHGQVVAAARELACSDDFIHVRMKRAGLNLAQVLNSPNLAALLHGRE